MGDGDYKSQRQIGVVIIVLLLTDVATVGTLPGMAEIVVELDLVHVTAVLGATQDNGMAALIDRIRLADAHEHLCHMAFNRNAQRLRHFDSSPLYTQSVKRHVSQSHTVATSVSEDQTGGIYANEQLAGNFCWSVTLAALPQS